MKKSMRNIEFGNKGAINDRGVSVDEYITQGVKVGKSVVFASTKVNLEFLPIRRREFFTGMIDKAGIAARYFCEVFLNFWRISVANQDMNETSITLCL